MAEWLSCWNINPQPWAIGDVSTIRHKSGHLSANVAPNQQLVAYQNAVREFFEDRGVAMYEPGVYIDLYFYFVRKVEGDARYADSTNLQKATEDALAGILYENDRWVRKVGGEIVQQDADVAVPGFMVCSQVYIQDDTVAQNVLSTIQNNWIEEMNRQVDNSW